MLGTGQDVSELRRAERQHAAVEGARRELAARREGEERFRIMADTAPVMVWMAGPGSPDRSATGSTGPGSSSRGAPWSRSSETAGPRASTRRISTVAAPPTPGPSTAARPSARSTDSAAHDGQYRWVLDSGTPRFGPEGFAGYVGSSHRHQRAARGGRRARAAARRVAGGPPGRGAGEPAEGRVPGRAVPRAAHAAQRDRRLGAHAAHRRARRGGARDAPWRRSTGTRSCRAS